MTLALALLIACGALGVALLFWKPWPSRISNLRRNGASWDFDIDGRSAVAEQVTMRVHYGDDMCYIGSQLESVWFARYADDGSPVPAYIDGRPDGLDRAICTIIEQEERSAWVAARRRE